MDGSNSTADAVRPQVQALTAEQRKAQRIAETQQREASERQRIADLLEAAEVDAGCGISIPDCWDDANDYTGPPLQIVEGVFDHSVIGIYGAGGRGKSKIVRTAISAIVNGFDYLGKVTPRPSIPNYGRQGHRAHIWSCEDSKAELLANIRDIQLHFDEKFPEEFTSFINVNFCDRVGRDNSLVRIQNGQLTTTPEFAQLREKIRKDRINILALDGINHVFQGDPNNPIHCTYFVNQLRSLSLDPLCVILLGHTSRAEASEFAGSAAWNNAVRRRLFLDDRIPGTDEPAGEDVRCLQVMKDNYGTIGRTFRLTYSNGIFVPDPPVVGDDGLEVSRQTQARTHVLETLREFHVAGRRALESPRSPDHLPKVMKAAECLNGFTEFEITSALNELRQRHEVVEIEFGRTKNRSKSFTLIPTP